MKALFSLKSCVILLLLVFIASCGKPGHRRSSKKFTFCFVGESKVAMANGTEMEIRNLKRGDHVMSVNSMNNMVSAVTVLKTESVLHDNIVELRFDKTAIKATSDHPFWVKGKGWAAVNPEKTMAYLNFGKVSKLEAGDVCLYLDKDAKITEARLDKIETIQGEFKTYTITALSKNDQFFVNGVAVGVEVVKGMP
jgi:hypothetical protein